MDGARECRTHALAHRVFGRDTAFVIGDILADRSARASSFGLENALATRVWSAVKTGTSKDMRDNWCVGFTDRYTIGVWVGNASGEAMHGVSGVSGAAPVWHALAVALQSEGVSKPPRAPVGVVGQRVAFDSLKEPARDEVFLAGTEHATQKATAEAAGKQRFGITSPRDGSIFAIDPDIPPTAQRITFEGERGRWVLDGKALGTAERWRWAPWPGRHRLTLVGSDDLPLQSVAFEVRGAGVKAGAKAR